MEAEPSVFVFENRDACLFSGTNVASCKKTSTGCDGAGSRRAKELRDSWRCAPIWSWDVNDPTRPLTVEIPRRVPMVQACYFDGHGAQRNEEVDENDCCGTEMTDVVRAFPPGRCTATFEGIRWVDFCCGVPFCGGACWRRGKQRFSKRKLEAFLPDRRAFAAVAAAAVGRGNCATNPVDSTCGPSGFVSRRLSCKACFLIRGLRCCFAIKYMAANRGERAY